MKNYLFIIVLFFFAGLGYSANSDVAKIDSIIEANHNDYLTTVSELRIIPSSSLEKYVKQSNNDLKKCIIYNQLCWEFFNSNPPRAFSYAKKQLFLADKLNNFDAKIAGYDNLAFLHSGFKNLDKSIEYMIMALKAKEAIKDTSGIIVSLSGLASIYYDMNNFILAKDYYEKAYQRLKNSSEYDTREGGRKSSVFMSNLGEIHMELGEDDKALEYYNKAIDGNKKSNYDDVMGSPYVGIGNIQFKREEYGKALRYYKEAAIRLEKDPASMANVSVQISEVYSIQNDFTKALIYGKKAVKYANLSENKNAMLNANNNLARVFYKNNNYKLAYEYFIMAYELKDSIFNTTSSEQIAEMQTKYDTEKKEAENKLLLAEKELDQVELEKKSTQQKMLGMGLGLSLIIVIYVGYSLNQKKKTNKLLNAQNEEISTKNEIIEEKNKDITDSINYAQRIQNAILPVDGLLEKHFESFVYYRPKDIVSGDFYWIKEVGDKIYFSVVDCTGHGVPGAFMSIIGHNSLNRIIDDFSIYKTGEILDKLNELVIDSVGAKNTEYMTIRDGMDLSICCIDKKNNTMEYSGAQNNLYLLRNNKDLINGVEPIVHENEISLYEFKADKMAVGGAKNDKKYITHSISLEKNDAIYLFSDGYPDQFGGPKGRKFMYKQFKKMFLDIQTQSLDKQLAHIDTTMVDWIGHREQLDDICIMGVKI